MNRQSNTQSGASDQTECQKRIIRLDLVWHPGPAEGGLHEATCSVSLRKATLARYWKKLRNDPKRWAERMENQRKRRESKEVRTRELQQQREAWAKLPKDHPRKRRKRRAKPESEKANRKRRYEKLTDGDVANRFLHMRLADCPKELIDFKREHIRLTRKLRTNIKSI